MKARDKWFRVPATYVDASGNSKPVQSNHAVPRAAWRVDHAHTRNEQALITFLRSKRKPLPGGLGDIVHGFSVKRIVEALRKEDALIPESTVRDLLRSLTRKHSIIPWNVQTGSAQPRRRGDYGGTTSWRLPKLEDVLSARRADPLIGTGTAKNTYFWVIGPGKRFLTQAEIAEWGLEDFVFEKYGVRAAVLGASEADFTGPQTAGVPARPMAAPTAAASPPGKDPYPAHIKRWLREITHKKCPDDVGEDIVSLSRKTAAALGYEITDGEIIEVLEIMRKDASKGVHFKGIYFKSGIVRKVKWWTENRIEELATRAAAAPKIATLEWERLIDSIVQLLKNGSDSELQQILPGFDPEAVIEARQRMAENLLKAAANA